MKHLLLLAAVALVVLAIQADSTVRGGKKVDTRVFEMRTYYAHPGKMQALHARFRDHTLKLFVKHGMTNIGYWSPIDPAEADKKLVYILAFPSREAAKKRWEDFMNDPAWKKAKADSETDGPLVAKVESVFLKGTDYSPIK